MYGGGSRPGYSIVNTIMIVLMIEVSSELLDLLGLGGADGVGYNMPKLITGSMAASPPPALRELSACSPPSSLS